MNKILNIVSISCLSLLMLIMTIVPATAEEKLVITESNIQELDQFVSVQNNQFVLEIPEYVIIDNALREQLLLRNEEINNIILDGNFHIDPSTKIASPLIQMRAYGVNKLSLSWNSIIIKMDAGLVRTLLRAAGAGGVAGAVVAFPALVALIAANPIAGVTVTAIVASLIASLISEGIKDGVEMHYNFFLFKVTVIKLQ